MDELKKGKNKQSQKNQCKLSSHCFMGVFICLFALRIIRANSALKRNKQLSTLVSSLLNMHAFLSFQIDQHITMIISITNGLLIDLLK
jgi:multisubunit Na+/H+ antiporter MnhF subunit